MKETKKSSVEYGNTKLKQEVSLVILPIDGWIKTIINKVHLLYRLLTFITWNLNPLSVERNLDTVQDRNYVTMMWGKCITNDLYKYICKNNNFMLLNQLGVTYQKAKKIIKMFIKENPHGLKNLINNLINDSWFINMFIAWFFQNIFLSTKKSVLQIHVNLCTIIKNGLILKGQQHR